jgi:hypothetical protein
MFEDRPALILSARGLAFTGAFVFTGDAAPAPIPLRGPAAVFCVVTDGAAAPRVGESDNPGSPGFPVGVL